ncbi:MAG: hypothetical protein ITG00_12305 [Flavobacterium sp.]|nr:hypothetical protein [Flavobacterium sp.]
MKRLTILLALICGLTFYSCEDIFEDWETEEDEYYYDDNSGGDGPGDGSNPGSSGVNGSYTFNYTCPAGSSNSITIPEGTAACQAAYEYFAKMYGCNEADFFNEANCRMCYDCGFDNYCSVCN